MVVVVGGNVVVVVVDVVVVVVGATVVVVIAGVVVVGGSSASRGWHAVRVTAKRAVMMKNFFIAVTSFVTFYCIVKQGITPVAQCFPNYLIKNYV
jgi:hypothetical protein